VRRDEEPAPIRVEVEIEGLGRLAQETRIVATNPLRVALPPHAAP